MACAGCGCEVPVGARFCSACGRPVAAAGVPGVGYVPIQEAAAREGLVRPLLGRVIAGVCAGFARRYGWDVALVRVVMVLAVLVGAGTPLIAYVIAWIVMPSERYAVPVGGVVVPPVVTPPPASAEPPLGAGGDAIR